MFDELGRNENALALGNAMRRMSNMDSENKKGDLQADLFQTKREFRHAIKVALEVKNLAANTHTDRRGDIADTLFLRNILTAISINQLLEPTPVGGVPALALPDAFCLGNPKAWPRLSSPPRRFLIDRKIADER